MISKEFPTRFRAVNPRIIPLTSITTIVAAAAVLAGLAVLPLIYETVNKVPLTHSYKPNTQYVSK